MFDKLPATAQQAIAWTVSDYEPYFNDLAGRKLTAENVTQFLADWTRLSEILYEVYSRLSVATTLNTADEAAKQAYLAFIEKVLPFAQVADQKLKESLLASHLEPKGFEIPQRNMRVEAEIFREENIPLMVEENKLRVTFDEVTGGLKVNWKGADIPMPQLQTEGQNPNRAEREAAWRLAHNAFLGVRNQLNEIWGKFLALRIQMARNAGFESYIGYRWKALGRFDYTPENCAEFHDAIEQTVAPAVARLLERKRQQLGVSSLRPWDLNVDPTHNHQIVLDSSGLPALKPYADVAEMEAKAGAIFQHVDPVLGGYFDTMRREKLLDLGSRLNKALGGYCTSFPVARRPFIFMNAVGIHDDVQTLLHEAGHAFHAFEAFPQPYVQLKDAPIEFCEVASMSMELLSAPYLSKQYGGYYTETEAARARVQHLEGMLSFWPYMAVVDGFQLWAYRNPDVAMDPAACDAKWAELWGRFMKGIDWTGLEQEMTTGWHRKLHIFQIPFYYVEYGLAQMGAAQVWRGSLSDQAGAVAKYRAALALGNSVSLPKLFEAAGAKFAFDAKTLGDLVTLIEGQIEALTAHGMV